MTRSIKTVLSIAGSDSGGGAGIQADLKTLAAFQVHGMTAITAVTVQNSLGVHDSLALSPDMVKAQIDAVVTDMGADAVKTGMLSGPEIVEAVADRIASHQLNNVVVDPVMIAKGGTRILANNARQAIMNQLFPLATVVTPNLDEASELTGNDVKNLAQMKNAARIIHAMGPKFVVVKGGHLAGRPLDLFFDGRDFTEFPGVRIPTRNTHGTGCTFSSAMAACLARGMDALESVNQAKIFISRAISQGLPLGQGHGPVNQMGLMVPLEEQDT